MADVVWSPQAQHDLDGICEFIARDSEKYARVVAARVIEIASRLGENPEAGSIVPEYNRDDLRERFLYNYRIVYRTLGTGVEVVTIVHGARLLPDNLATD